MAEPKVNTSQSLQKASDKDLDTQIKSLNTKLKTAKKEKVSFPVGLQKNLGTSVFLGLNGSHVIVPVDGEDHEIPAPLAKIAKDMIKRLTT